MADTGWIIAGTGANDSSYGDKSWANPDRVTADDGSDASFFTFGFLGESTSQYLKATNYGHAIPADATIDGIEVRSNIFSASATLEVEDDRVRLIDELGAIGTTDRSSAGVYPTDTANLEDRGGAADLWGDSWSETDVEDIDFGFTVACIRFDANGTGNCDAMWTKIHYTEGGGGLDPVDIVSFFGRREVNPIRLM